MDKQVLLGNIINSHALKGEMKVKLTFYGKQYPWTADKRSLLLKNDNKEIVVELESTRWHQQFLLIKFKGYDGINSILWSKNYELWVEAKIEDFQGQHWLSSYLIGYEVVDDNNLVIGTIKTWVDNNSTGLWEIILNNQQSAYIPNNKFFLTTINHEKSQVSLNMIEGLLSEQNA